MNFYIKDTKSSKLESLSNKIPPIPKFAPGGLQAKEVFFEEPIGNIEIPIRLKTITKKRFIKLLMARGYQRNEAEEIHQKYMVKAEVRTQLGMEMFLILKDEPKFQIIVGANRGYQEEYTSKIMGKFNTTKEGEDQ